MIHTLPPDFRPDYYDLQTSDGKTWKIGKDIDRYYLYSGDLRFDLMVSEAFTFFASGYNNINLNGFTITTTSIDEDGNEVSESTTYELVAIVKNENWQDLSISNPIAGTIYYSKLKLCRYLKEINIWDEVKAFIEQAGVMDEWLLAQDLASDDDMFLAVVQGLRQSFPEVDVETILEKAKIMVTNT